MEQEEYDELQRQLAECDEPLTDEDIAHMERLYHAAASVDCSVGEFQEFDERAYLFFALLLREVKRLRCCTQPSPQPFLRESEAQ